MVLYPPGTLAEARESLDRLGFQRQQGRDPFPEDRPMRVGSVVYEGFRLLLHAQVIAADSPEVATFRAFRDRLRADPGLADAYAASKREILAAGITDPVDYCAAKGVFVEGILREPRPEKVSVREKLALFHDHWSPRVVGELNGQHVKLVKFRGEFVWHRHDHEDELFLVVHGRFRMDFRDRQVRLGEGEFLIVPRGLEHRPVAEEEVHVLLFEPAGTLNTGDVRDGRTVEVGPRSGV
jgi:mannose-6-phosphate isomerase-like protein (cupin superfamily)